MPLIQIIVSQVMNLKPQLIDSLKDEEDVKAIARLFADIGDSYVELIATGNMNKPLHQVMGIFQASQTVLKMESQVLNILNFHLSPPTVQTFLRRFIRAAQASYQESRSINEIACMRKTYIAGALRGFLFMMRWWLGQEVLYFESIYGCLSMDLIFLSDLITHCHCSARF
ncbi:putative armadillo-like helical, Cyclin-like superfamily [Helianthus annuus]|nr:putative armadillo-like helical, Cyclin-like superfamily [Helianthus annuus]